MNLRGNNNREDQQHYQQQLRYGDGGERAASELGSREAGILNSRGQGAAAGDRTVAAGIWGKSKNGEGMGEAC